MSKESGNNAEEGLLNPARYTTVIQTTRLVSTYSLTTHTRLFLMCSPLKITHLSVFMYIYISLRLYL